MPSDSNIIVFVSVFDTYGSLENPDVSEFCKISLPKDI